MKKQFLDAIELSEMVAVSVQTIYNNTYRIPGRTKIGNRVRYCLDDVEKALKRGKLF